VRIVVLFNLKPTIDIAKYEEWARSTDIPGVRAMKSVADFKVHRATGLLGSDQPSPYAYVEVIDVADMPLFWQEIVQPGPQKVAAEFREFLAGEPVFITTETL
jgi:hypothetical protein